MRIDVERSAQVPHALFHPEQPQSADALRIKPASVVLYSEQNAIGLPLNGDGNLERVFDRCGPRIALSPDQEEIRFRSIDDLTRERLSEMIQGLSATEASAVAAERWKQSNLDEVRATWTGLKYLLWSTNGLPTPSEKFKIYARSEVWRYKRRANR